jgi:hypothetical protein
LALIESNVEYRQLIFIRLKGVPNPFFFL